MSKNTFRVMDTAYIRDNDVLHTKESVILACLLHAKANSGRKGKDMEDVQRMMKDINLEKNSEE